MKRVWFLWIIAVVASYAIASCSRTKEASEQTENELLVEVGDSALYLTDVINKIPRGLDSADSLRLFHNIVDTWIRNLVLTDVAANNIPDPEKIERMVESYRNSLIVNQYLSSMAETDGSEITEHRIREYYDSHKAELILKEPLVKGGMIKVADEDNSIDDLRKWMSEFSDVSVDKIEKSGMRHITRYEYFRDEWHEWSAVADQIPYRFGDADAFVKSNRNFETMGGGSVYLLHISEYVVSGSEMPYEFAKLKIREILRAEDSAAMRTKLLRNIYRRKIGEGGLKPGLYDPIKGEMINKTVAN